MKTTLFVLLAAAGLPCLAQNPVDPFMGDWKGTLKLGSGNEQNVVAAMIPLGGGKYEARFLTTFDQRVPYVCIVRAQIRPSEFRAMDNVSLEPNRAIGTTDQGVVFPISLWSGRLEGGTVQGTIAGKTTGEFKLTQFKRTSPALGTSPPAGAVVLFDGKNLDAWQSRDGRGPAKWKVIEGDCFQAGGGDIMSREKFKDMKLHIEFRLPYMPTAFGQGRGNSGVYPLGRYEVQVLDSYGLEGADNECGGIYTLSRPSVNMCLPPLEWQSYDITFHMARFDENGKKSAPARITVVHNGVTVQDNVALSHVTGGAVDDKENQAGPLVLQDHGNPVQYRNAWIQRLE
jgi:hypothetical protein